MVCKCNIHKHTFTCRKPPNGWFGCRLCKPSGQSQSTRPVQLKDNGKDADKRYIVCTEIESSKHVSNDLDEYLISDPDVRVIVWEIQRRKLDQLPSLPESKHIKDVKKHLKIKKTRLKA